MHTRKALTDPSSNSALKSRFPNIRAGNPTEERFFVEDGWVFREHHGKYVECVCRSDEVAALSEELRQALPRRI